MNVCIVSGIYMLYMLYEGVYSEWCIYANTQQERGSLQRIILLDTMHVKYVGICVYYIVYN